MKMMKTKKAIYKTNPHFPTHPSVTVSPPPVTRSTKALSAFSFKMAGSKVKRIGLPKPVKNVFKASSPKKRVDILNQNPSSSSNKTSPQPQEPTVLSANRENVGVFMPLGTLPRKQVATALGIPLIGKIVRHNYFGLQTSLTDTHAPKHVQRVGGAGQCLFNCLSFLLYGDQARAQNLRIFVCSFLSNPTNWERVKVWINNNTYNNGAEYVQDKNMMLPTVWATEVELNAWAVLTGHDVCVWDGDLQRWIRHAASPQIAGVYSHTAWYLRLMGGHFEPVLGL